MIISTLCFHHLPDIDREYIIGKIRDSLKDNGIFINGDVFKAGDPTLDDMLNDRWEKAMIKNGLSTEQTSGMIDKRKAAAKYIDTPEGFKEKLLKAGFEKVFCFYSYDIYGVFAAFK